MTILGTGGEKGTVAGGTETYDATDVVTMTLENELIRVGYFLQEEDVVLKMGFF